MGVYLVNFLVYSMAMVGLLFVCLMVYKKTMVNNCNKKNTEELAVENAMNLSARKTLYIVKAGNEKFLIASDAERTTFLAKLNAADNCISSHVPDIQNIKNISENELFENTTEESRILSQKNIDYSQVMDAIKLTQPRQSMMKEILRKLDQQSIEIQKVKE